MKRQELTQIKDLDLKELRVKAKTFKEEIANLVMDKNMKKLKDVKVISKKRKDLAQVLTILKQKQMLGQLESISKGDQEKKEKSKAKKRKAE